MNPTPVAHAPSRQSATSPVLGRGLLLAFALPGVLQGFMTAPAGALLQGMYAKHAGIALVALGTAVLLVRIADAMSDLLIGMMVDRSVARSGSRKPWIVAGTVVTVVALWFLLRPPVPASAMYFGFWFLLANVGWSLTEIPYRSWSLDLSRDYVQRARVQTWIAMAVLIGGVVFYMVPYGAKALGLVETAEFNLKSLALTAVVAAVITPLLNIVALLRVPDAVGHVAAPANPRSAPAEKEAFSALWQSIAGNKPLLWLLLCFALITFLAGLQGGVSYLYFDNYLGLAEKVGLIMALAFPATALSIPFWGWMCARYQRQRVWAISTVISGLGFIAYGFLPPKVDVAVIAIVVTVVFACLSSSAVVAPAILGDIVDYGVLKFGRDRAGLYMSLYSTVLKGAGLLAGGLGMIALGWMGFDATQSGDAMSADSVFSLKLFCAWIPAFGILLTVPLMWNFPIRRADQERIKAELKRREENHSELGGP